MRSIEGRHCVVTGAAKGIGLAVARRYAELGARVTLLDLDPAVLDRAAELARPDREVRGHIVDITNREAVIALLREAQERWGPVWVLCNVAGAVSQNPVEEATPAEWEEMMAVNVYGAFWCVQAVLSGMKERREGRIINFSSKSGKTGSALMIPYSAAKGAVMAMTQGLAHELAPWGILCNCLCPGITDATGVWDAVSRGYVENLGLSRERVVEKFTGKIPLGRLASVEDIADYVEFLTRSGDYCTGQSLNITGGREMH